MRDFYIPVITIAGLYLVFFKYGIFFHWGYSSEIYPTSYRDFALGFFFTSTLLEGFFVQIIYLNLFKINIFLPYYTICAIAILGAVLSICLPFETYGIPLDFDHIQETKVILSEITKNTT